MVVDMGNISNKLILLQTWLFSINIFFLSISIAYNCIKESFAKKVNFTIQTIEKG